MDNKGFNLNELAALREKMSGQNFHIVESEDNSTEYVNFNFIGHYEGKEVIFDAVIYTLRLQHNSEMFEIAESKAADRFPEYKNLIYAEDENGDFEEQDDLEEEIGLFMAEIMMELEEEETIKVQEHVEVDPDSDYGIGLDIGLNVEEVDSEVISKFVIDYNSGALTLDNNLYSFQHEQEA